MAGADPYIHRVASSQHYSDPLVVIRDQWTTGDLAHALAWLDAIAEASDPGPLPDPKTGKK